MNYNIRLYVIAGEIYIYVVETSKKNGSKRHFILKSNSMGDLEIVHHNIAKIVPSRFKLSHYHRFKCPNVMNEIISIVNQFKASLLPSSFNRNLKNIILCM